MDEAAEHEQLVQQVDAQLESIAAERERIAGELHDDSIQAMTAVSLQLQRLTRRIDRAEDLELLQKTRSLTDSAIDRLRHMLFTLHPATLEEDGLVETIEIYLDSYVDEETQVECRVHGDRTLDIPMGVGALGFRLAREAISNSLRHANASRIDIEVTGDDNELTIVVSDDGTGFDADGRTSKPGHLGLAHARRLAEAALGSHHVLSAPGSGTTVTIKLPMRAGLDPG